MSQKHFDNYDNKARTALPPAVVVLRSTTFPLLSAVEMWSDSSKITHQ